VAAMIRVRLGTVLSVTERNAHIEQLQVSCEESIVPAVNYPELTGSAAPGDQVILNTTAVYLNLGTGGFHFVMAICGKERDIDRSVPGHIMKLRYTPLQVRVSAIEEEESPYHEAMCAAADLQGMPVAVATVHSLIAPFAIAFKNSASRMKLAYIMTDGAALPLAWSHLVRRLRQEGLIDITITCGHAFGGEVEAVTFYSALHAAHQVLECRACIVAMGPGVVGTGTPLGTTALEQAFLLDAAGILGARQIAVPRLSFADPRPRHRGLSHHTLTVLGRLTQRPAYVCLPHLEPPLQQELERLVDEAGFAHRHRLIWQHPGDYLAEFARSGIALQSMGRTPEEDPAFFAAGAAAGKLAAAWCLEKVSRP